MAKKNKHYEIIFLRHGESQGNIEGILQGQNDFPLTERGREQAHALAKRWVKEKRKFDYVISSPLGRAHETAEIITKALGISVDELDPNWLERNYGKLAGTKYSTKLEEKTQPSFRNPYQAFGGNGEGDAALYLRASQALHAILNHEPGRYLVVSHGTFLNCALKAIAGIPPQASYQGVQFHFGNTAFASVAYLPHLHRWYIQGINDHCHWREND